MRRCVHKGKPSNVYDIKSADGLRVTMTQECDLEPKGRLPVGRVFKLKESLLPASEGAPIEAPLRVTRHMPLPVAVPSPGRCPGPGSPVPVAPGRGLPLAVDKERGGRKRRARPVATLFKFGRIMARL